VIKVSKLVFDYPGTRALNTVSFTVAHGSITALVGPNGAGKTTLLRCLAALEEPLSGTISIDGVDILANPRECHHRVGYLSDFFGLYDELSVRQCLTHAAAARGVAPDKTAAAVNRSAERLGIADRLDAKAGALSRGLRQRLAIAQAIIHQPMLLLLDEPASGLDPEARHSLASLFTRLRDEGMTLVVSSHILAELDEYSTDMLVLRNGRLLSHETVRKHNVLSGVLRLSVAKPVDNLDVLLAGMPGVSDVRIDGLAAIFSFSSEAADQHRLLQNIINQGIPVHAFGEVSQNLQQAYLESVRNHQRGGE
jgi:ABC-2 type transport system ATP-binding protein